MRVAVVVFPGTNCEHDVAHALSIVGAEPELVWHRDPDLSGAAGVILPGGFAHGDYLRTGAIARFSPIMRAVEELAAVGRPVLVVVGTESVAPSFGLGVGEHGLERIELDVPWAHRENR
jgi:phosphoribosylformylglycinamidine synthase